MIPPYCAISKCLVYACVVSPRSKTWVICRNARNHLTKFWVTIDKFVKHGQNIMYLSAVPSNMPWKLGQHITYLSWSYRWYCSICFQFRVLNVFWHAKWWLRDNHTTKHCMYPDALIPYVREERNRPNSFGGYRQWREVQSTFLKWWFTVIRFPEGMYWLLPMDEEWNGLSKWVIVVCLNICNVKNWESRCLKITYVTYHLLISESPK